MSPINKFLAVFFLVCVTIFEVQSLHLSSQQQHHRTISKQCCTIKGGFECGNTFKDCCVVPKDTPKEKINRDLCVIGGIFNTSEFCPGEKITEPCNYCQKQCQEKKGAICGLSNGESDQCCLKEDCIPDVDFNLKLKKCKPGKEIKLTDCVADMSIADQLFGQLEDQIPQI